MRGQEQIDRNIKALGHGSTWNEITAQAARASNEPHTVMADPFGQDARTDPNPMDRYYGTGLANAYLGTDERLVCHECSRLVPDGRRLPGRSHL